MTKEYSRESVTELTSGDRGILASYGDFLDGLADYLGSGYEFVLHSLENLDHSVIKIINGYYTGRTEGAPITDLAMKMLLDIRNKKSSVFKSYFTKNKNGAPMKSSTIGIQGENGNIIGLLCINFYLETSFAKVLDSFTPDDRNHNIVVRERHPSSIDELVSNVVSDVKDDVIKDASIPPGRKNGEIVRRLDNQGYFSIKDSVPQAAEILGVSKTTIYMHLRKLQKK
jgi:predicted transcriptional regulator YheO